MSHLTQSYNSTNFDVNANQSASISTTEQFFQIRQTASQTIIAPVAGQQIRIGYGHIINTLSGLTVNTVSAHSTTYAISYTLATDGIYLIKCSLNTPYLSGSTGSQGYYLRETSTGNYLSSTDNRTRSNIDYPHMGYLSGIIEIGGTARTFDVYCIQASQIWTSSGFPQSWCERLNFLTIQRLK